MNDFLTNAANAVINGSKKDTLHYVKQAFESGLDPAKIISDGLTPGLYVVGQKFEEGEYFLPDMMLAADAMGEAVDYLEPLIKDFSKGALRAGRMVIGTVKGDLHSIGKNIVIMMMKSAGFQVFDLGIDVPTETFVDAVEEKDANILGISALMTTTIQEQKKIIELLEARGLRDKVKVIVGGAPLSEEWAKKVGADAYAADAIVGVKKAKNLLNL